jgi:hypothetical protein
MDERYSGSTRLTGFVLTSAGVYMLQYGRDSRSTIGGCWLAMKTTLANRSG